MPSIRLHTYGPLMAVAGTVLLAFMGHDDLVWVPATFCYLLVLSLVGAMWSTLPRPPRGGIAMGLLAVPGINAIAALWLIGGWPAAVEQTDPEVDVPSAPLFQTTAALFGMLWVSLGVALALDWSTSAATAVGVTGLFFVMAWLAVARQACETLAQLGLGAAVPHGDAPPAEWARERHAVAAALARGGGADAAWAQDVVLRHAKRGEPEALAVAAAMREGDREALVALLADIVREGNAQPGAAVSSGLEPPTPG